MKKYLFLPLVIFGSSVFAQFTINGQFANYGDKPILIKLYDNGHPKTIQTVKADANGNFSAKIPVNYSGIVRIETPSGASLNVLSDNENIKFRTTFNESIQTNLEVLEGNAQKEYIHLQKLSPLNDLQTNVFPHIKKMYQSNDTFYKAIEAEESRIIALNKSQAISSSLVKYMQNLDGLMSEIKSNVTPETANKILSHIESDDERLEHSGYLPEMVFAFINNQFTTHPNETPENNVQNATELLLEKGNIQTERGQNILSSIFNLVPEQNFPIFYSNYKSKVNSLTCKVTDDLKSKVNAKGELKMGDKVPNISFQLPIKGKKSLYDIKANQKIVVFWASWCPACVKEMPYVKEFYNEFKKNGGEIVAISLDYDQNEFEKATKDFGWYNYTDLLRWDSPIAEAFKVNSTPTLFLLDKENKIIQVASHITEFQQNK